MPEVSYLEAIREGLIEEMERDPDVFCLGEDIGRYGGAFKVTEGLLARFGDDAFAVCLRSNDPHKAGKVAAAMVECLNDPVAIGEDEPLSALRRSVPNSWTRESWSGARMSRSTAAKASMMPIASSTRTPMRRCANNRSWIGFGLPARRPEQSLFRHGRAAVADIHFARRTLSSG